MPLLPTLFYLMFPVLGYFESKFSFYHFVWMSSPCLTDVCCNLGFYYVWKKGWNKDSNKTCFESAWSCLNGVKVMACWLDHDFCETAQDLWNSNRLVGLVVKASASRVSRVRILLAPGFFRGRVIPVTSKLALQWLPCQAPGVIGSVLGLVGPVSVIGWGRTLDLQFLSQCGST